MRKMAVGLAALTVATAGSTLTAPALPSGGPLSVAQHVRRGDNVDQVHWRESDRKVAPAYGFQHPILGRQVHKHVGRAPR